MNCQQLRTAAARPKRTAHLSPISRLSTAFISLLIVLAITASPVLAQQYCDAGVAPLGSGVMEWDQSNDVSVIPGEMHATRDEAVQAIIARSIPYEQAQSGYPDIRYTIASDPLQNPVITEVAIYDANGYLIFDGTTGPGVRFNEPICPSGYVGTYNSNLPIWDNSDGANWCQLKDSSYQACPTTPKPAQTRGAPPPGSCQAGNPCDVATGNKYQRETDYTTGGHDALIFARYYNSDANTPPSPSLIGASAGWRGEFDRTLTFTADDPIAAPKYYGANLAELYRQDGKILLFTVSDTTYQPLASNTVERLSQVDSQTWQLTTADDAVETYVGSSSGGSPILLQSIRYPSGYTLTLTYSASLLSTVTDSYGRTLNFTYNDWGYLGTMTDPIGNIYTYEYDDSGNLSDVVYPDLADRQYQYTDYNNPGALTATVDENGSTYATWTYDSERRAVQSQHADGADTYGFTYNLDGITNNPNCTTTVTIKFVSGGTYAFSVIYGVPNYSCVVEGSLTNSATWDANGWPLTQVDRNGNTTTLQYNARGLETSRTEAYGTPIARTITSTWNPNFRVPASISEPDKTTSFTYDGNGNVLTKTITDTTVTPNTSRIWTYTYDSCSHVLTARGPRTDLNSITSYAYYPPSAGALCGFLHTVTDAVGNITTYNTYDASGMPLTVADPNGVVTTLTYDARERISSRQVGSETTRFAYYPTGLLQTVTLPDASYINYTYDDAHRLTMLADGAGNYITYTLDAMGNRTADNTFDPLGTLHSLHTRAFNNLNELYQDVNAAGSSAVTTSYTYDNSGNQTGVNAPLSRSTTQTYDQLNRLKQRTDAATGVSQFTYDANDSVASSGGPQKPDD